MSPLVATVVTGDRKESKAWEDLWDIIQWTLAPLLLCLQPVGFRESSGVRKDSSTCCRAVGMNPSPSASLVENTLVSPL